MLINSEEFISQILQYNTSSIASCRKWRHDTWRGYSSQLNLLQRYVWGQAREMATAWFNNNLSPTWDLIVKALICIKKQAAAKKLPCALPGHSNGLSRAACSQSCHLNFSSVLLGSRSWFGRDLGRFGPPLKTDCWWEGHG